MTDLDQMSVEMLESVSRYIRRLRHRSRSVRPQAVSSRQRRREAAMLSVNGLESTELAHSVAFCVCEY